ncbi:hypothetical protein [Novipirellula aureliae]|uniref:hypothetical protein n=1 Tax=Novipirellula aureliae TaxID=2527966 RepID=UPI001E59AE12|nr:hypothetical protein [Novipirellula aureliae]
MVHYVSIRDSDRHPDLKYAATIHHGIPIEDFPFKPKLSDDLLFFGRIHPHKGAAEAISVARSSGRHLHLYGIVQDRAYYEAEVAPAFVVRSRSDLQLIGWPTTTCPPIDAFLANEGQRKNG